MNNKPKIQNTKNKEKVTYYLSPKVAKMLKEIFIHRLQGESFSWRSEIIEEAIIAIYKKEFKCAHCDKPSVETINDESGQKSYCGDHLPNG